MINDLTIGVVIPVYNRYETLCNLLSSISSINPPILDILIIDNASTDGLKEAQFAPNVEILSFPQNYGPARGFNEGVRHLMRRNKYKYLWLLDSDLIVTNGALTRLVDIMEADSSIGVCGSIIYNVYNKNVIVESGANIDLGRGLVVSLYCNEPRSNLPDIPDIIDVDFVGSGVSLLRTQMVEMIGLYDERYYFLWEDMDYGLYAKQNGWRVVVSRKSEVYHPPFTEKRNPNIYAYYGVRNPLLTVAKYSKGLQLPWYLYHNLCRYLRVGLLAMLSGRKAYSQLTSRAISDYIFGRFGKADLVAIDPTLRHMQEIDLPHENQVFILGLGSSNAIQSAVSFVRAKCHGKIILVVQNYRYALITDINVDSVVTYDDRSPKALREYLKIGISILRQGGCLINTDLKSVSPLNYFGRRTFNWDDSRGQLYRSHLNIFTAWKLAAAVILGNLLALLFLPLVWIASLKHKMKQPVLP